MLLLKSFRKCAFEAIAAYQALTRSEFGAVTRCLVASWGGLNTPIKCAALMLAVFTLGSPPTEAQELAWPDPEPSECLSVSFHEQVAWARIRSAVDDYDPKAFERTHDEWRDCRRIFRVISLEPTADIEEVERLTAFANALADARRSPVSFGQLSPLACLQAALLGQANASLAGLPSEEACKLAGYWARIASPDEDSPAQKRGRARFIADTIKELEVAK